MAQIRHESGTNPARIGRLWRSSSKPQLQPHAATESPTAAFPAGRAAGTGGLRQQSAQAG